MLLLATTEEEKAKVSRSAHLAYEKVTLSADAAKELGVASDGAVSMSGRKGLGVKADDLIDRLEANALQEVQARHADFHRTRRWHGDAGSWILSGGVRSLPPPARRAFNRGHQWHAAL